MQVNSENLKHLHWNFVAYDEIHKETGNFQFAVEIDVVDWPIESVALQAVKKIVLRKNYYLRKVWECSTCALQEKQLEFLKQAKKNLE